VQLLLTLLTYYELSSVLGLLFGPAYLFYIALVQIFVSVENNKTPFRIVNPEFSSLEAGMVSSLSAGIGMQ
jgi:hypothetical protein